MSFYDELVAWSRALDEQPPIATVLECGQAVWELLADEVTWKKRPDGQNWPIPPQVPASLTGVLVVVKADMPLHSWRFLDIRGDVVEEGTL